MWKISVRIALLGSGLWAVPVTAAGSAWLSEWDDDTCSLVRQPQEPNAIILALAPSATFATSS